MSPISRKHIFLVLVVVGIAVALAFLIARFPLFQIQPRYAAVYLESGDLYFGKLSRFPSFQLSDVWFFRQDAQGQAALERFSDAVWKPAGPMRLNRNRVVFWAFLDPSSQVVQAIEGRLAPQQIPSAAPEQSPPEESHSVQ